MNEGGPDLSQYTEQPPHPEAGIPQAEAMVQLVGRARQADQNFANRLSDTADRLRRFQEMAHSSRADSLVEETVPELWSLHRGITTISEEQSAVTTLPDRVTDLKRKGRREEARRSFKNAAGFLLDKRSGISARRHRAVELMDELQAGFNGLVREKPGLEDLRYALRDAARTLRQAGEEADSVEGSLRNQIEEKTLSFLKSA